jgi:imidazolonepropionase-like amidohydrolase
MTTDVDLLCAVLGCLGLGLFAGCARGPQPVPAADTDLEFVLRGGDVIGHGPVDVEVRAGRITAIGVVDPNLPLVDVTGRFLAPAFIDSHVHLTYLPVADALANAGVAAAVDLAAPLSAFDGAEDPLDVIRSGPMLNAPLGYPTQSWGQDGYGLEVTSASDARARVKQLAERGAGLVKIPFGHGPVLDDATVSAIVDEAHERGLLVAAHALSDEQARRASMLGCDVLAHTPTEPLSDETIALLVDRTIVSTLAAFGGGEAAVDNLSRLHQAGARIVYGTDLGNTRDARIDPEEIELLTRAGLDGNAILAAGASTPAQWWAMDGLGAIDVDKEASLLVLDADPRQSPAVLCRPRAVLLRGRWR